MATHDAPLAADPIVNDLLERGLDQAESGRPAADREALANLSRCYYHHVDPVDLQDSDPADLIGTVTSHRRLAEHREPGTAVLAVFTPTVTVNGWSCGHTVIQIVTDDMPFLVDSVTLSLTANAHDIHLVIHPQLVVRRDGDGHLLEVLGLLDGDPEQQWPADAIAEAWIHVEINRESDPLELAATERRLAETLADVRAGVNDWPRMAAVASELAAEFATSPPPTVAPEEAAEAVAFLEWLAEDNFTFLGYREYDLSEDGNELAPVPGSSLGIMREASTASTSFQNLSPQVRQRAREPHVLVLTKANTRSTVHRNTYLDYVGVKRFDAAGRVTGERRFLGLYTGAAYSHIVAHIPVLRRLLSQTMERVGCAPDSHRGKDLLQFIETYPRDDLFQMTSEELYQVAIPVLAMQERRQTRVFLRRDVYGRFYSILVYLPRDRYTTTVRLAIQDILMDTLDGVSVDYATSVSESVLARLHYVIRVPWSVGRWRVTDVDLETLQTRIRAAVRSWDDDFADALVDEVGEETAAALFTRYAPGIQPAYREMYPPRAAVADVLRWEGIGDDGLKVSLYEPLDATGGERRLKLFRVGEPVSLLEVLPLLAALDVEVIDEHPYAVSREGLPTAYLYDFGLRLHDGVELPAVEDFPERFCDTFVAAFTDMVEPDRIVGLVTRAGLSWRQASYVQSWVHYLRQIGSPFTLTTIAAALMGNPGLVRLLVALFETEHDPDYAGDRDSRANELRELLSGELDKVVSLDHDRILRQLIGLVAAILRTNAFQLTADGVAKPWLSFKLQPRDVPGMPAPRPKYEIWVSSPKVAGVHLRFGNVARGGLRWSDRRDDFRTEVLGLVKAQEVKNAVIVPVGSKGGFVVKRPLESGTREEVMAQGQACYRTFISGLLDLTDNRVAGQVVPPARTVRRDGDDSYLVVAADKGTATFSDLANSISAQYNFWLGDAFASGGSVGYDHKAMGITARGAWESVKRHFRELGVDCQTEPFTVIGVGDMSGDVFGNGMLLSEQTKLVAAFDHRHIFLDPNPDPAVSFAERQRMFELPRSSWDDYDRTKISTGGGVHSRAEKSIPITAEVRDVLGLREDVRHLSPPELLRAILQAPVDLMWNGGIGTYVKATVESDLQVGDKANDAIRIDGAQLRVRIVGEGGNLGLTQLGRIEAARHGVLINTDAVDNSAGVDCSDHEVNIKILLDRIVANGDLTTKQRNNLLVEMTDQVADLVLSDNYEQNVLLGNARVQARILLPVHERMMHYLERAGVLDRPLEFLPDDERLAELAAAGQGLSSPEFCTLMAYAKISLTEQLNAEGLESDPFYDQVLQSYFPHQLVDRFGDQLAEHPLRRQIVSTVVANSIVNRGGITFVYRVLEETGASAPEVARAYSVVREVFDLPSYWAEIEALDNQAPTLAQAALFLEVRRLLDRATRWFLTTRGGRLDVGGEIARFLGPVRDLAPEVPALLMGAEAQRFQLRIEELIGLGAPAELSSRVAGLLDVFSLLDISQIAGRSDSDPRAVAQIYFQLSERFGVDRLLGQITGLRREDRWDALARSSLRSDLYGALAGLTARVIRATPDGGVAGDRIEQWERLNAEGLARAKSTLTEIAESPAASLATISVALRVIRTLVYQAPGD